MANVDQLSNPPFYDELIQMGFPLLDISNSSGITFVDCIVIRKSLERNFQSWVSILFHELVHVTQYQILGSRKLVEEYVRSWIQNGYSYHAIPFEVQAYRLEARFRRSKLLFSVRKIVEQELKNMV